jgi:hypothetical protein
MMCVRDYEVQVLLRLAVVADHPLTTVDNHPLTQHRLAEVRLRTAA